MASCVGWVAERFKAPVLKTGVGSRPPWVRIPPHPPLRPNRPNGALEYQPPAPAAETLTENDAAEAREQIRGLVEAIRLIPEDGRLRVEVRGALGAILALADGARLSGSGTGKRPGFVPEALLVQVKMDAGTGFEPVTFRL